MMTLDSDTRSSVITILHRYLPGANTFLVGSRARGTDKRYADIDLLLVSPGHLTRETRALLNVEFDESDIPYKVDLIESDMLAESFRQQLLRNAIPL